MFSKICFIGEKEAVDFWRGFGIDVFNADDENAAGENIKTAVEQKYDLIYVTKTVAGALLDFIEKINFAGDSIITIIPGVGKSAVDLSQKKLKRLSIKAIGSAPPED